MACPAIPTCGLAISEAERALPGIDRLSSKAELQRARPGAARRISVRMTGCPNGCARPYQSDIGIVGRSGDKYTVFVGGSVLGTRLNFELKDLVPLNDIVPLLMNLLREFQAERTGDEFFGDFCQRLGPAEVRDWLARSQRFMPNPRPSQNQFVAWAARIARLAKRAPPLLTART